VLIAREAGVLVLDVDGSQPTLNSTGSPALVNVRGHENYPRCRVALRACWAGGSSVLDGGEG
jgi:hypothetical protein